MVLPPTAAHATAPARVDDYDGDGRTDPAYYRPSPDGGTWWVGYTGGGQATLRTGWGELRDEVVPGDYNGDALTDIAVFRPWDGSWSVAYTGGGTAVLKTNWGIQGDLPVPGDYKADGRFDMMVFRPDGSWLAAYAGGGTTTLRTVGGSRSDIPVPGDFDGDGSSDLTIFRPRDGSWSVAYASGGTDVVRVGFGTVGDLSLPASTIPGTPGRTDGLTKPVYFVHGYVWGSGTDCDHSYWANAVADFRLDGDPAYAQITRTVGFYQGDTNCDVRLAEGTHDTPIEELGRLLGWEIYRRYSRFGVAVDVVAHSMGGLITMAAISGTQRNLVA